MTWKITRSDIAYLAKSYFKGDDVEREYLQHVIFEECQRMRSVLITDHEMEISLRELYLDQITYYQHQENYGMCQLLVDSAARYEIDIEEFGLDNG